MKEGGGTERNLHHVSIAVVLYEDYYFSPVMYGIVVEIRYIWFL